MSRSPVRAGPRIRRQEFGGHLLTLATRLAWDIDGVDRVWLHTPSLDHPHALSTNRSRGFGSSGWRTDREIPVRGKRSWSGPRWLPDRFLITGRAGRSTSRRARHINQTAIL